MISQWKVAPQFTCIRSTCKKQKYDIITPNIVTLWRLSFLWKKNPVTFVVVWRLWLMPGLSPGFLAERWKWPSITPVPGSLGYLQHMENQIKIRHHHSHFVWSLKWQIRLLKTSDNSTNSWTWESLVTWLRWLAAIWARMSSPEARAEMRGEVIYW